MRLWEESQMGPLLVSLQVHRAQRWGLEMVNSTGWQPVSGGPSWEPSQKGWSLERPQEHQ